MMFEKPPLIELVAEFRWIPVDAKGEQVTNPALFGLAGPLTESFYESFRKILAAQGYNAAERLIPQGLPYPMYQPVFRYRRSDEENESSLFQLGIGLLSVHALPPYKNWEHFRPIIETGLSALLKARTINSDKAFTSVSLRYINAFGPDLVGGRTMSQFVEGVLGMSINLPLSVKDQIAEPASVDMGFNLTADIKAGLKLVMSIGRNVRYVDSVILDISVVSPQQVTWDILAPMNILESAHSSIRHTFFSMTEPIHNLMHLVDQGGEA